MVNFELEDRVREEDLLTDEEISSLKRPVFKTILDGEIIDFIHSHCKRLLEFSKEKNQSKEVAKGIDLSTFEAYGTIPGSVHSVNIGCLLQYMEVKSNPFLVMHNHPSDTSFSYRDLNTFVRIKNMMVLMVIGNHGSIYIVEKTKPIFSKEILSLKKTILDCKNGLIDYETMIIQMKQFGIVYSKM